MVQFVGSTDDKQFTVSWNMQYHPCTTQVSNLLFDHYLKTLSLSQLKVLLLVIRRTIGQQDKSSPEKRVKQAWIAQKLFCMCTGLSNKAVSDAIDDLVKLELIVARSQDGRKLSSRASRKGQARLFFEIGSGLVVKQAQTSEPRSKKPVKKVHTIKLSSDIKYSEDSSQAIKRLSDSKRFRQLKRRYSH
ncbi:MAG: hypothetical protein JJ975_01010 [Bacteroidia bacterium]|nr:hypothetical protein [Bacteroidia bacterium]